MLASEDYSPFVTGGAVFEKNLVGALSKLGHSVEVIEPSQNFQNKELKEDGVLIHQQRSLALPFQNPYRLSFFPHRKILEIIRDYKPDIIHVHSGFSNGRAALTVGKMFNIPVVSTNHNMPNNFLSFFMGVPKVEDFFYSLGWKYIVWFNNQASFVTSPSEAAIDLLKEHGLKVPSKAISDGVDLKKFHPEKDSESFKKKFNLPSLPIVIYTGRLDREKEIDLLVKAIPSVLAEVKAHFAIGGRGKDRGRIEGLVKSLQVEEAVTFLPFLEAEVFPQVYNTADLYCIPSQAELLSITTLEAMASGLPVVARNAGALPELVHDGENGYLFEGNVEDLSQKIIKILQNKELKEKMSKNSREMVQKHDFAKTVKEFESLYSSLIREAKA